MGKDLFEFGIAGAVEGEGGEETDMLGANAEGLYTDIGGLGQEGGLDLLEGEEGCCLLSRGCRGNSRAGSLGRGSVAGFSV